MPNRSASSAPASERIGNGSPCCYSVKSFWRGVCGEIATRNALITITRAAFRERCRMMTSAFYRSRGFDQGAEGCFWVVLSAF